MDNTTPFKQQYPNLNPYAGSNGSSKVSAYSHSFFPEMCKVSAWCGRSGVRSDSWQEARDTS